MLLKILQLIFCVTPLVLSLILYGTIQNSEGQQTDIAGIPHTWCCPLLSGTGQGSLQGIGHP